MVVPNNSYYCKQMEAVGESDDNKSYKMTKACKSKAGVVFAFSCIVMLNESLIMDNTIRLAMLACERKTNT